MSLAAVPDVCRVPLARTSSLPNERGAGRTVHARLSADGDAGCSRQSVAEAVRASRAGDLVVVDAAEVVEPSVELAAFLVAATAATELRGASLRIQPHDGEVVRQLEREGLYRR
jgi:hypothetical protein